MLVPDRLLHLLPFHTERWIGQQVVEGPSAERVVDERVAISDVAGVLTLEHEIRAADRVGLLRSAPGRTPRAGPAGSSAAGVVAQPCARCRARSLVVVRVCDIS